MNYSPQRLPKSDSLFQGRLCRWKKAQGHERERARAARFYLHLLVIVQRRIHRRDELLPSKDSDTITFHENEPSFPVEGAEFARIPDIVSRDNDRLLFARRGELKFSRSRDVLVIASCLSSSSSSLQCCNGWARLRATKRRGVVSRGGRCDCRCCGRAGEDKKRRISLGAVVLALAGRPTSRPSCFGRNAPAAAVAALSPPPPPPPRELRALV
jgi:hypothetical protein